MKLFLRFLVIIFVSTHLLYAGTIQEAVEYLASDKLEGRKPGQRGNILATHFIEQKLKDYKLSSLGTSYLQDFTIFTEMEKIQNNQFKIGDFEEKFQPISYSLSGFIKQADVVFAGFGISIPKNDPQLIYDDYQGIDVEGKIVIVFTGDPGIGNQNSKFRMGDYQNYSSLFYKLKNAIAHKAAGILIIQNPLTLDPNAGEEEIYFNHTEGGGSRFSIIAGKITNDYLNKKLENTTSLQLQKKIAKTQKPMSFSLKLKGDLEVNLKKITGRVSNIVGFKKGQDGALSKEVIIIGAHMDHLGFGGESSMDPQGEGKIHYGADDNASGSALVLDLAQKFSEIDTKRSYVFVLFNAEEMGLLGSQHFVEAWSRYENQYGKIVGMLNFDMVGRYSKGMTVMGIGSSKDWSKLLPKGNYNLNFQLKNSMIGSSDHASFINQKVPSLFFTSGPHEDYHRSTDTADKINYVAISKLSKYSLKLIQNIDDNKALVFNTNYQVEGPGDRNRGYGAHLGCVPDFGQPDGTVGVLCMRASEGSPAMQAGLKAGDILVQIGTIEIKSIYDLAFALKYYRAGDQIEIAWMRVGTLFKHMITLTKPQKS